jgi:methylated-DNA-[protein]-cysteine S-methyltransferase
MAAKATTGPVLASSLAGPWGPIHVAATPSGIVAIDILAPRDVFESELVRRLRAEVAFVDPGARDAEPATGAEAAFENLRRGMAAVEAFLMGEPEAFDRLSIDLADRPDWDHAVLAAVRDISWGSTASYGEVAAAIGRRGAARAVGGAVGRNPISLAIPCHRVIAGDGSLGGYGGGWWGSRELRLGVKRDLLGREGTTVPDDPSPAGAAR